MTENSPDLTSTSTKHIMALHSRRSRILREIEEIERATLSIRVESNEIYDLKEEYNLLIDEEEKIRLDRSADPPEVLPPELWPDILPSTAGELLVLTLVCDSWRNVVLSVPKMWSWVELDGRREDYLAQTIACFTFSAPLEVILNISLPLVTWKEILPLVVAERARISSMNITSFDDEIKPAEALEMISDLGDLPNLVSVRIPYFYDEPELIEGDLAIQNQSRGIYPGPEALFKQAPSLLTAYGWRFTREQLHIMGVTKLELIHIHTFHREVVESLSHFHKLTSLRLVEEKDPYGSDKTLPRSLDSSLASITTFYYHGLALGRALRCIGPSLEVLDAKYVTMRQLPDILESLQLFPRLRHLGLHIDLTNAEEFANPNLDAFCLSSVTSLSLSLPSPYIVLLRDPNIAEDDRNSRERTRKQACKNLFQSLVFMMPNVEEFDLERKGYYDAATYIQSLRKLRSLDLSLDTTEVDRPLLSLSFEQLESVRWYGEVPARGVFNVVQSSTLRELYLRPRISFSQERQKVFSDKGLTPTSRFGTPSNRLTNLRVLSVTVEKPLPWDLRIFPRLAKIELSGLPFAVLAGDFFEELLLQPASCPFLKEIGIKGHYVEWDLLILLLERRNFATTPSISPIKTIQLENNISYKLLRPMSALLRGKYIHRDSIEEFSSTAMGKLLWDPLVPGCEKCLRAFRGCTLPTQAVVTLSSEDYEHSWISSGDRRLGKDYPLLLDPLSADPPLHPDIAQWLAGKKERRRTFSEGCREARSRFHRPSKCGSKWGYNPSVTITSDSLDGAVFGHDADE